MIRTTKQNRALHLWYTLLAKRMVQQGLDMRKVLEPSIEITPTKDLVKNYIWRPVQIAKFEKVSTTQINHEELQEIYNDVDKHFLQEHKIFIPFPSIENIGIMENLIKEHNI